MFTKFHILELPLKQALEQIKLEINRCKNSEELWLLHWWASDICVVAGDFQLALEFYPKPTMGRAVLQMEKLLNLKLACEVPYTGDDVLTLLGPKVTKFGRSNLDLVKMAANMIVEEEEPAQRVQRMKDWAASTWSSRYSVFNGAPVSCSNAELISYTFVDSASCVQYCSDISRRAENMVREDAGLPNIGEGWISETKLFRELQLAFSPLEVIHHGSPFWLGRQHLDVYIPELRVGVEFQGPQHDYPIDFFGGEEAFKKTRQRDARKRRLCSENKVSLIFVRPGYDLDSVVLEINQIAANNQIAIEGARSALFSVEETLNSEELPSW